MQFFVAGVRFSMCVRLFLAVFLCSFVATAASAAEMDPKIKEVFKLAQTQRIAVVGVGDSNQRFGGKGWTYFMAEALYAKYGCYALPLAVFSGGNSKAGSTSLPPEFADKLFGGWYLPAGQAVKGSWDIGAVFTTSAALDAKSELVFTIQYGMLAQAGGSFRPAARRNETPWKTILQAPERISTAAATGDPAGTVRRASLTLPADPARTFPVMFSAVAVGDQYAGPFVGGFLTCEDKAKQNGVSYHTLYASGGQSLYDMLKTFRATGTVRLADYFLNVRSLLGSGNKCVVMICSALNDRNEKEQSHGPVGGFAGKSPEAYYDNLKGITLELQKAWIASGGAEEDLFFAFMPSHPLADPDDAQLVSYRQMAVKLAAESDSRAGCILLPDLIGAPEMAEKKYYDGAAKSSPHLAPEGYREISQRVVEAIAR